MRKKTYLSFKDLRAAFDKEGRVRLSSGDPRLKEAGWSLTLNRKTRDEQMLHSMLDEHLTGGSYGIDGNLVRQAEQEAAEREAFDKSFITPANTVGNSIRRGHNYAIGALGPFLGQTIDDDPQPVFYSPAADAQADYAPLCLISGKPGSGANYLARKMISGSTMQGAYGISLSWHDQGSWGARQLILRDQPAGFLNPFVLGEDQAERIEVAMTTLTMLLGSAHLTSEQYASLKQAVEATIKFEAHPSLERVIEQLDDAWGATGLPYESNALSRNLWQMKNLPQASLIFGTGFFPEVEPLTFEPGLTSIVPLGLRLPDPNMPVIQRSNEETLAATIAYLTVLSVKSAMTRAPKSQQKAFSMDESWIVTQHHKGRELISEMLRFGRNLYMGITLAAQRPQELLPLAKYEGSRIIFEPDFADQAVAWELLHGSAPAEHPNSVFDAPNLKQGQFFMKDAYGRTAKVQISGMEDIRPSATHLPW